ncbi:MAG TPA: outer membrane beta-barrel protein [Kofleriaceae bacterium]|jgi:hypothetical protein|nr:outer membrane beta-barrel protein [Kofleriaceae bacterium]
MKKIVLALVLSGGVAAAQPDTAPVGGPPGGEVTPPTPPEPPTPPVPPEPPAPPPAPPPMITVDTHRPVGFTIGIGLGYDLPTSLQSPNVTSVRFRLASGLTFEPVITLGGSSTTTDDGIGNQTSDKTTELDLGTNVRWPHNVRDRVDLVLVGSAGLGVLADDPMGDGNNTTTSSFTLGWGLGLDYWVGHHVSVSLTATNPLLESQKVTRQTLAGPDTSQSTTTFGLIWRPNVILMAHLFL